MGNEVAITREVGSTPDLLRLARSVHWLVEQAREMTDDETLSAAIEECKRALIPLEASELVQRDADGNWNGRAKDVRNWLKPFGMSISPGLAADARTNWLNALVVSLSDLPPNIVIHAAKEALHTPMTFLNEVHGVVRVIADRLVNHQRIALGRLRDLQRAIEHPPTMIGATDEGADLTPEQIRAVPKVMQEAALAAGWITQQEIDAAFHGIAAP